MLCFLKSFNKLGKWCQATLESFLQCLTESHAFGSQGCQTSISPERSPQALLFFGNDLNFSLMLKNTVDNENVALSVPVECHYLFRLWIPLPLIMPSTLISVLASLQATCLAERL